MAKHKDYQFWIPVTVIGLIVIAIGIGIWAATQPIESAGTSCSGTHQNHVMTVYSDKITPENVDAKHCDTLTITNGDSVDHTIMFGHHDSMMTYDGVMEKKLAKGQSFTVTLRQAGDFAFHDAEQTSVIGMFSVK